MAGAPQGTFAVIPEISYRDISYIIKNRLNRQLFFWIIKENEVHVRRVTREAYHWKHFFATHKNYEYRYSALDLENDKRHLDEEHEEHLKGEDHTRSRCRWSERIPTVNAGFAFCADFS